MFYTVIVMLILVICWSGSCIYCFNAGVTYQHKKQKAKRKIVAKKSLSELEMQKNKKFMRELENLFSYDGTVQE